MKKYVMFAIAIGVLISISGSMAADQIIKPQNKNHIPVCQPAEGRFRCHSRIIVDEHGKPLATLQPNGYSPSQFINAYRLTGTAVTNQTIAVIDAYDDPNIVSDLNTYSNTFGLQPLSNCNVSQGSLNSPCFQKVNQNGGNSYPAADSSWGVEISLDVEMAHAICQNCNILLVEANSNYNSDLMAAVDQAVNMGATVISNSYGSNEFYGETSLDNHFNHPGIGITFSSGDSGYGAQYPAASPYVTAVGGTSLYLSGNSYVSESVWSGTGSGCSIYEAKPLFQSNLIPQCTKRIIADVSADADPNTGAAIYDTFGYGGWLEVGGTSLSSPIIAGVYASGGINAGIQGNSIPYSKVNYATNMHDITTGSNGGCRIKALCKAVTGYDGPSGLGTPNTNAAFKS